MCVCQTSHGVTQTRIAEFGYPVPELHAGKTTVAKLYGRILADFGLLSNGAQDPIVKNPSDFKGAHVGHSERNTRSILKDAEGRVLIIDEARPPGVFICTVYLIALECDLITPVLTPGFCKD